MRTARLLAHADAPEIDGLVYIDYTETPLQVGQFVDVKFTIVMNMIYGVSWWANAVRMYEFTKKHACEWRAFL